MLISGLSVICAIVVMNINHHSDSEGVPQWVKVIFLQTVATCLCLKNDYFITDPKLILTYPTDEDSNNISLETKEKPKSEVAELKKFLEEKAEEKERRERNKEEWQFLAIVIDRMLFCVFGAVVLFFLFAIFIQLLAVPRPPGY